MSSRSPPGNPQLTSVPQILSPVSPKPLHFPTPSNIPVLENQIDLDFNQMATHVSASVDQQAPVTTAQAATFSNGEETGLFANEEGAQPEGGMPEGDDASQDPDLSIEHDSEMNSDEPNHAQAAPTLSDAHAAQTSEKASHDAPHPSPQILQTSVPSEASTTPHETIQHEIAQDGSNARPKESQSTVAAANGIDYQALLDTLSYASAAPQAETVVAHSTANAAPDGQPPAPGTVPLPANLTSAPTGLPPRPPPQAQPSIHQNYAQSNDIRMYHPHAQNNTAQPYTQPNSYRPAPQGQSYPGAALPPGVPSANGLPPPPLASFQQSPTMGGLPGPAVSPTTLQKMQQRAVLESQRERKQAAGEILDEEDMPWTAETQKLYEKFLTEERNYVTEGNWEQFPYGSRLFVGNLSSERVTKRDIFHVFYRYGRLAQISIKQAYGFVQFLESACCGRALQTENGRIVRGKKINLEISKPQKNKNNDQRRRSRSPDMGRAPAGVDRYVSGQDRRNDRGKESRRGRDDYRPRRSPSPRSYRGRDRSRERSRERYSRYRSRSRSPYGRNGRHRSPHGEDEDEDLPLPRRAARDVPDVQIIIIDDLDRNFVNWIQQAFVSRGIKTDAMLLSPRLSESAVVRRQIMEGVVAVSKLSRTNQQSAKIPLQVFDRKGGADVRFEEYVDLDPTIAAEVVLRARASNAAPSYGYGYGAGLSTPQPPQPTMSSNVQSMIGSMDPNGLQKLLGAMQHSPTTTQPGAQQTTLTPDLTKLLNGAGGIPQQSPYGQPPTTQDPLAALRSNPALAGLLAGQQGSFQQPSPSQMAHAALQPGQPGQPDMADILARLGSYRR